MKLTITAEQVGARLDKLLVELVPGLGRAGAKRLFADGKVRVASAEGKRPRRASKGDVAAEGEVVEVELDEASDRALPDPEAPLTVLLETAEVIVLDKPAGQPTAPLGPKERGTLANALVARYPEVAEFGFSPREPGICHRLDTDTSGVVLAARTAQAFAVLTRALKEGRLDKRYLLICNARDLPESGSIEIPLAPHPKDRRRVYACAHPRDVERLSPRPATTAYQMLREHEGWALVEARAPKAARHQIRAHFAAIGHPLAGDALYGGPEVPGLGRHALHAHYLGWPGDAQVPALVVRSPLPDDMAFLVGEVP